MLQASRGDGYHAGVFPIRGQNGVRTCRLQLRRRRSRRHGSHSDRRTDGRSVHRSHRARAVERARRRSRASTSSAASSAATAPFSFVSLAVQHFFWHGGEKAVVVRVANRATRATLEIPAGREVLRLQARQPGSREHLRVSVDYDRVERTPDKFNLVDPTRVAARLAARRRPRGVRRLVDGSDRRALHRRRAAGLRARAARRAVAGLPARRDARPRSRASRYLI